jgi:hypothetical protein
MSSYRCTYKNQVSMVPEQPSTFFLQEVDRVHSKTPTYSTYNESCKGCAQRSLGLRVQTDPFCKCPLVLYVPKKDTVQEMVSALKSDQGLMTSIGEGTELHLPIWHCGTREAFLMHM